MFESGFEYLVFFNEILPSNSPGSQFIDLYKSEIVFFIVFLIVLSGMAVEILSANINASITSSSYSSSCQGGLPVYFSVRKYPFLYWDWIFILYFVINILMYLSRVLISTSNSSTRYSLLKKLSCSL